mmetsp:Transcript_62460/g.112505  ORF Transcript_62460/g.112505 Transcript_62460/m.112505 type:complete len:201 (-) Transcript_62460:1302-1904(-)
MHHAASGIHKCSEQKLDANISKMVVVEIHMREYRHLHDVDEPSQVRWAEVQMLQIYRRGDGKELRHVDVTWQTNARSPLALRHDVVVGNFHVVFAVECSEAAVQSLGVDVVDIQRPHRCSRRCPLALLSRLVLEAFLRMVETVHCRATGRASTRRCENLLSALQEQVLAAWHCRNHGYPELGCNRTSFEETPCRLQLRIQ